MWIALLETQSSQNKFLGKYFVALKQRLPPDDGHMDARNMYRREMHKYIKQNCVPSWIYI